MQVVVQDCPSGLRTVPPDYLGLSVEWSMVQPWFGTSSRAAIVPMSQLLASLLASAQAPGVLRIGGNSQDGYRWRPDGSLLGNSLFAGVINHGLIDALLTVTRRANWKLIVGLNLADDRPAEARALAHYVLAHDIGHRVLGFELGNEPNHYFGSDLAAYRARFRAYSQALTGDPVTKHATLVGPAVSNEAPLEYLTNLRELYRPDPLALAAPAGGGGMPLLTWHHYANRPTLAGLLEESVTTEWTNRVAAAATAAGGLPVRMDEGNSVGHGGRDGVSNVTGSTAWLIDTMLSGAAAGLAGYNLHAWDAYYYPHEGWIGNYTPFAIRGRQAAGRPGFYALALLKDLPAKRFCNSAVVPSPGATVKAWAVIEPGSRRMFFYAVNKTTSGAAVPVNVAVPAGYAGTATLSEIVDPAGCAGRDTTINGAALPASGSYPRPAYGITPAPDGSGYHLKLDPCQSAVLAIPWTTG